MNVGIVFSAVAHILRRVIVPDMDSQLDDPSLLAPGETLLVVSDADYRAASSIDGLVLQKAGVKLASSRCAVVDPLTNKVEAIISADPAIDSLPGKTLMLSATVKVGDTVAAAP